MAGCRHSVRASWHELPPRFPRPIDELRRGANLNWMSK